jgi:catechol 2,3-dioxygenase-like lactoylglutathione lyase family enzyme
MRHPARRLPVPGKTVGGRCQSGTSTRPDKEKTMETRLAMVTLDCADPRQEAEFWAEVLGFEQTYADDNYAMLKGPDGPAVGFGRVDDYVPPVWPNPQGAKQFHFDLAVADIDEAARRCVSLGARVADPQPGDTWRVMLDPAGHPFCLTNAANWG